MEYRVIGKTGIPASIIGLGTEHLDGASGRDIDSTIHAALDAGINIIDVFMPGPDVRRKIGHALKGRRDRVLLQGAIGSTDIGDQYDISRDLATCKRYFEDLLRYLQTDCIDFGMLFFMDSDQALDDVSENGILAYARQLKKEGKIRAIGASSHNPDVAKKLVLRGWIDLLMFSINPAFDMTPVGENTLDALEGGFHVPNRQGLRPERHELYQLCEKHEVGITVMKTYGAGKLLSAEHTPFSAAMTTTQCIHYALSRPAVASALVGCESAAEVSDAVRYLDASAEAKDYTWIFQEEHGRLDQACVYCSHCQPCPVGIDIASVHKYLDIALLGTDRIPPSVRQHYLALPARGEDCITCGQCETRCPFAVPIMENMRLAETWLGRSAT